MRKMFESFIADRQLRIVTTLILCFSAIILMLPFCFTQISAIVDFTVMGLVGATIGGITAPFFAICSIFFTFFSISDTESEKDKTLKNIKNRTTLFKIPP